MAAASGTKIVPESWLLKLQNELLSTPVALMGQELCALKPHGIYVLHWKRGALQ